MKQFLRILFIILAFLRLSYAQVGLSSAAGIVEDATNARLSNASVRLVNTQTGAENDTTTNKYGVFFLPDLIPGDYMLEIKKRGFATARITGVMLATAGTKQFLIHLRLGSVSETVTVDAVEASLDAKNTDVGSIFSGPFASELPLGGRSIAGLIAISPGIVPRSPQSAAYVSSSQGDFSVNGQSINGNNYTVDGVPANINPGFPTGIPQVANIGFIRATTALGTTQGLTSIDGLQEFRVLGPRYSAEYGRTPGGQFVLETKAGTNTLHGSIFDYLRNRIFDANAWFNNHYHLRRPTSQQNDFGGTLGGAVVFPRLYNGHNKTFFFADYEGFRGVLPIAGEMKFVPSLSLRTYNSGLKRLLNTFPLPTGREIPDSSGIPSGLSPYMATYSLPGDLNSTSIRIDHKPSSSIAFFARYNGTPSNAEIRNLSSLTNYTANSRTLTMGATLQLTPVIVNDFRVGYSRGKTQRRSVLDSFRGAIPAHLPSLLGDYNPGPYVGTLNSTPISSLDEIYLRINGVGSTNLSENYTNNTLYQWDWSDGLDLQTGHDSLKFGIASIRFTSPIDSAGYSFEPSFYSRTALIANQASNISLTYLYDRILKSHQWSAYIEDEWRLRKTLSLSTGLRWVLDAPPREKFNASGMILHGNLASPSSLHLVPGNSSLWRPSWDDFAPRIGVAWSPLYNEKTIFRAGAGIFYGTASQVAIDIFDNSIGMSSTVQFSNMALPITRKQYDSVFSQSSPPYTNAPAYLLPGSVPLPYTLQWSTSAEQSIARNESIVMAYIGVAGKRLLQKQTENINNANPEFGYVDYYPSNVTSSYNAFEANFKRSFSRGLEACISYTWAHNIDFGSTSPVYPLVRGNADQDVRHNLQVAFLWSIRNKESSSQFAQVFNRWNVSGTASLRSAFPVELYGNMHSEEFSGYRYFSGVDLIAHRPLYRYGPEYPGGKALNGGFQVNNPAFVLPMNESSGDAPRNIARGFGMFQVNLAIYREFPIYERFHAQLRVGAFNLFNHPNFGFVDPDLADLQFGRATRMLNKGGSEISPVYQQGGARSLQILFKVSF